MRSGTIVGLIAGLGIVFVSIFLRGGGPMVLLFFDFPSFVLTGGCTICTLMVNYTYRQLWDALKAFRYCLVKKMDTPEEVIDLLVNPKLAEVGAVVRGHFLNAVQLHGSEGPEFVAAMSQGTSGDQQWMDYSRPRPAIGLDSYAAEVAEQALRISQRFFQARMCRFLSGRS